MQPFTKPILFILCLCLSVVSCDKDDDSKQATPVVTTKSSLLVGTWELTAITVDPPENIDGVLVSDIYAQMEPCDQDDTETYKSDKTYLWEEGATKCISTNPQVIAIGSWAFNSDETLLIVDVDSDISESKIKTLTANKMVLSTTQEFDGVKYTYTISYVKQ